MGAPVAVAAQEAEPAQEQDLHQAVEQIERYLERYRNDLQFRIDKDSGRVIVSIVDRESGEVLRQVPGDEALRLARMLARDDGGLLDAFA